MLSFTGSSVSDVSDRLSRKYIKLCLYSVLYLDTHTKTWRDFQNDLISLCSTGWDWCAECCGGVGNMRPYKNLEIYIKYTLRIVAGALLWRGWCCTFCPQYWTEAWILKEKDFYSFQNYFSLLYIILWYLQLFLLMCISSCGWVMWFYLKYSIFFFKQWCMCSPCASVFFL